MMELELYEKIQLDPEFFVTDIIGAVPWEKQREILRALRDGDEVAVKSCHNVGKSWVGAKAVAWFLSAYPYSTVWTTAPTGRQVYNILWREIRSTVNNSKVKLGGEILKTMWEIKDKWFAYGFATDKGESFQGVHSESSFILGVVDEASGVDDSIFQAAESTLSSAGAKLLMLGNPNKRTGYFAESFKRKGVTKITISCFDTPNFKANNIKTVEDLKNFDITLTKIVAPHLITPQWAQKILQKYGETSSNFLIRVLGEFPEKDSDTLVSIDKIEKAFYREVEISEHDEEVISCDPARFGNDRTVIIFRKGLKVLEKEVINKEDTMAIAGRLKALKRRYSKAKIKIDTIGLGAGIYDKLKEESFKADVISVNVAEKAIDDEEFENLRMEIWWNMSEWLEVGSLPKDDDFLEIAEVKYRYTSRGKKALESKDDIKSRIGKSPDVGDALAISFAAKQKVIQPNIRII